jgi:hypothetical protein
MEQAKLLQTNKDAQTGIIETSHTQVFYDEINRQKVPDTLPFLSSIG